MRKAYFAAIAASAAFAAFTTVTAPPAHAQAVAATTGVEVGRAIYSSDGKKLGSVYKVTKDGAPQVIISGKLITVPASSVSVSDNRVVTSLTRKDVLSKR